MSLRSQEERDILPIAHYFGEEGIIKRRDSKSKAIFPGKEEVLSVVRKS